jgi:hypothetical protein
MELKLPDMNGVFAGALTPDPASTAADVASDPLPSPDLSPSEPAGDRVGTVDAERFVELSWW